MADSENNSYFNLEKQERDAVVGYLLTTILNARHNCHIPSNEKLFDEDVNIYMAHLLLASTMPDYQTLVRRYLSLNASELMELVEKSEDKVMRYFIYKVNADYLLVHLGIFNDLTSHPRPYQKSERQFIEMGQSYYHQASEYNHQIYRKHTAVGDVLIKLSQHFPNYKKILETVRGDFFSLSNKINSPGQKNNEQHDTAVSEAARYFALEQKQNEFLDLYGEWLKIKSPDLAAAIEKLVAEIKAIDPSFGFNASLLKGDLP